MKINSSQKGFTLIELLVVIAIIGILSSIVIASVNSARQKAQETTIKVQLKELATGLTAYFAEVGEVSGTNAYQDCISPESLFDISVPPFGTGASYTTFNAMNNTASIRNPALALYNNQTVEQSSAAWGGGAPTGGGPYKGSCTGGSMPSTASMNFSIVVKSSITGKFYCASVGRITPSEVSSYNSTCN
jgi:prepilin-type N-terminal cleavage/methylation domain-containing protein